jgi:hypothetical protein
MKEFPLPAPKASAEQVLPDSVFGSGAGATLGDMDRVLSAALDATGYGDRSYLWVPDGFAIVTRMEQIYSNGRPKPPRFATNPIPLRRFSLDDYLRALFTADPGYYRVIVFVVTPHPVSQASQAPSAGDMDAFVRGGASALPEQIAVKPRPPYIKCTALVYEFENTKITKDTPATWISGDISGKTHLVKAGLWAALHLQ